MRPLFCLLLLCLLPVVAPGQPPAANPFEITARLPEPPPPVGDAATATPANPFDLRREQPAAARGPAAASAPIVVQPTDPAAGRGSLLTVHLVLLFLLAALWVSFPTLLRQCLAGTLNDNLMSQLYRNRSGGQLGALWVCHLFFFLAAGCYGYLFAVHHDVSLRMGVWPSFLTYALVVSAAVGLKHLVLGFFARLFPVRREVGRYAFVLMVFSILAGIFLVPVNLLVSYAPPEWRMTFLYAGLVVLGVVYLLHLMRGLFIANRHLGQRPLHVLLYICAIEIAPLLLVYRYLSDTIPNTTFYGG